MFKMKRFTLFLLLPLLLAGGLSLGYTLFHLHHLQQFMDWDQFAYIGNIYQALRGGDIVFNPHHLHFEFTGGLFHDWMKTRFGDGGFTDLIFNLRLRSVLAAAAGLFFLFLFLHDATGRFSWALLGTMGAGFTHGYLAYAAKIDTGIFPVAAFCLMLWLLGRLCRADRLTLPLALALGVSCALGVFMHQFLGFACLLIALALFLPAFLFKERGLFLPALMEKNAPPSPAIESRPRRRWQAFFAVSLSGVILIGAGFFLAGKSYYNLSFGTQAAIGASRGVWKHSTFQKWLFTYETADKSTYFWGTGLSNFYPFYPWRGFTDAFLAQKKIAHYSKDTRFAYNMADLTDPAATVENAFAVFTALTLLGCLVFSPALWKRYKRIFFFPAASLPVYAVFFTYWEPHYYEFWILPALLLIILNVLLLNLWGEKLKPLLKQLSQAPFLTVFAVFLFLFIPHNLKYYQAPFSRKMIFSGETTMKNRSPRVYELIKNAAFYKHPGDVYREVYPPPGKKEK